MIKMRRILKNKNLFTSWLISYIIILILPIIFISIASIGSIRVIEQEINKGHMASLKQLQKIVDDSMYDIEKLSTEIAFNEKNNVMMYLNREFTPADTLMCVDLIKDYKSYQTAHNSISELFVYYKNGDFIITGDGKYSTRDYYKFYYSNTSLTYEQLIDLLSKRQSKTYLSLSDMKDSNTNSILFLRSIPIQNNDISATIGLRIKGSVIKDEINNTKWLPEDNIYIIDSSNNVVISSASAEKPSVINYSDMDKKGSIIDDDINGNDVYVTYLDSGINSWKYMSVLPRDIYLNKATHLRRLLYISIVLCLIIGVLISYYLTRKNSNPIYRIVSLIRNKFYGYGEGSFNYDYIEESIIKIIDSNTQINDKLNAQNKALKDNFLYRLIKENITNNAMIQEACDCYNIHPIGNIYYIVLFHICEFSNNFINTLKDNPDNALKDIYVEVGCHFDEMLNNKYNIYYLEIDGMLCCIINTNETEHQQVIEHLQAISLNDIKYVEDNYGLHFSSSISGIHTAINELPDAYKEALQVIEYKNILGGEDIKAYDSLCDYNTVDSKNCYRINEEHQFINCIKVEDYKGAEVLLNTMFSKYFSQHDVSVNVKKMRMYNIMSMMLDAAEHFRVNNGKDSLARMNAEERLISCKNILELKSEATEIVRQMDHYTSKEQVENYSSLKDKAMEFINNNYQDVNLSLTMIAEELNINEAYLSRAFKKLAGFGLLEYIQKVRIEKSKQLMDVNKLNVKEAAEKVGYFNSISFIRVFKKYEGITPGKYIQTLSK